MNLHNVNPPNGWGESTAVKLLQEFGDIKIGDQQVGGPKQSGSGGHAARSLKCRSTP